jgi:glycosyltransferase involved in cell wall biosynthesis
MNVQPTTPKGTGMSPASIVINGKFLTAGATGVHRVAEELILAMDRIAAEGGADGATVDADARLDLKVIPFRTGGLFRKRMWEQIDLPRTASDRVVLSLCNIGPAFAKRGVTMMHDAQVHITPQSYSLFFRAWYRFIQPLIGRRNAMILTVSNYSADQIAFYSIAPREKIAVVHNGVDHVLRVTPKPEVVGRLGLGTGRYALALGSLQVHKNLAVLFRAFSSTELRDVPLVLFGADGRAEFERAGFAVPPSVVFAGRVDDGELRSLMEAALCLVFPSTTEGFGLPPLEAMMLGCPAVVAPCGALPEVCGDAALYADPQDDRAWIGAIRRLADDPAARTEAAARGKAHAARYTWDTAARAVLRIVRQVPK